MLAMAVANSIPGRAGEILVEVAYALAHRQLIIALTVSVGSDAEQAIKASGMLNQFPDIDLAINKIGIFGKLCKLNTPLRHSDRVEIYRPLIADPKQARKQRAAAAQLMKKDSDKSAANNTL
jgi:putative ubiquitin-RnfH superfamily antitoxin RatB of RatAB toxin-antitoxin module